MKLLANENIPLESVHKLRELGYDVKSIGEDDPSITDQEILTIADNEQRLILTFDKDYGELIFRLNHKPQHGIIFLRLENFRPDEPALIIHSLLSDELFNTEKTLTVFDGSTIRQRKY